MSIALGNSVLLRTIKPEPFTDAGMRGTGIKACIFPNPWIMELRTNEKHEEIIVESQKNTSLFKRMKRYHELFLQEYEEVEITKRAMANRDMKAMAASAAKGKEMYKERQQLLQGFPAWLMNQWMLNIRPMVKPFGIGYQPLFLFKLKEWMTGGDIKAARGRKILEEMDKARQGRKPAPKEDDSSKGAES